jgi:CheY-like chemotaxis protein
LQLVTNVLVVEDDADIRRLVVTRVRAAGHTVLDVGDAEAALALVAQHGAPDVAILDVGLPGMKGTELLVELRARLGRPDFPAVFLSALVNQEDIEAGRSLGAAYLTKPVVASALLAAIRNAVPPEARGW